MTRLALVRHGPTAWTEQKRIQGHTDVPLSAAGREAVRRWRLPSEFHDCDWHSSPLRRAVETAELLGAGALRIEARLAEMSWGAWEGRRLVDLRRELGRSMARNEARGLDFRPQDGESPREVQARLIPWLRELGLRSGAIVAVTHKGVINAVMALATGWEMTGPPPAKVRVGTAQIFDVEADGHPRVVRLDLELDGR